MSLQIIIVQRDCLEVAVRDFEENTLVGRNIVGPLGVLATLVIALITVDFREAIRISGSVWEALFIMSAGLSGLWLLKELTDFCRRKRSSKSPSTPKELCDKLLEGSHSQTS